MFKSRAFNLISAVLFFVVAGGMFWAYQHADELLPSTTTSQSTTVPVLPSTAPRTTTTTPPAPRQQQQTAETRTAQRQAQKSADQGFMKSVGVWLNKTFGLHLLKEETKSMISLLCGIIGSIFSFRTYLLSRRRTQLLEDSLKNRSS